MSTPMSTDEELLKELANPQIAADKAKVLFQELYQRQSNRVMSYALKKLGKRELAEEAVQIIFWKLFEKRHLYDPQYPALAWLYTVSQSEIKDLWRREQKHPQSPEDPLKKMSQIPAPFPNKGKDFSWSDISGWDLLTAEEQKILQDRYATGLSFEDMAIRWNRSSISLRKSVSRLLSFLRGME